MRIINLIFALLFAVSALLQYNDPDPLRWALVYLAAAAVAIAVAWKAHWNARQLRALGIAAMLLTLVALLWMLMLAPGMGEFIERGDWSLLAATMQAGDPVIEDSREFLGLGIVLLYSLHAIWTVRRRGAA